MIINKINDSIQQYRIKLKNKYCIKGKNSEGKLLYKI